MTRFVSSCRCVLLVLIATLFPVVGFAQTTEPLTPRTAPGLDGRFVELARQVPGFGGYFFDANGDLNVYLTDLLREPAARAAVADVARSRGERSQQPWSRPAEILIQRGDFDFLQLDAWRERLNGLTMTGVHLIDTDEGINRIFIGVAQEDVRPRVLAQLDELGVPRDAVVVDVVPGISPIQSLQDNVRPLVGGLQIDFVNQATPQQCTLGVNVLYGNLAAGIPVGTPGFYTAAHCSAERARTDGTVYTQGGTRIGVERYDPPYFTEMEDGRCPPFRLCRNSDVAFVEYDAGVNRQQGAIAQTQWRGFGLFQPGSLDISPSVPTFTLTYTALPVQGMYLDKVGRTTGWTTGAVRRTCTNYNLGTNFSILCQDQVDAYAQGGDSGSPVFQWIDQSTAAFSGIVWAETDDTFSPPAGGLIFSNLNRIAADLGFGVNYGPN